MPTFRLEYSERWFAVKHIEANSREEAIEKFRDANRRLRKGQGDAQNFADERTFLFMQLYAENPDEIEEEEDDAIG